VDPSLEDRQNQIGVPLLCVARSETTRQSIIDALRRQQADVAADRADTLAGEVFAVVLDMHGEDDIARPRDVAAEVNRLRAKAGGVEVDKLGGKQRMSSHAAGKIMRTDLGLHRLLKDSVGARYQIEPGRLRQLCLRFGEDPSKLPGGHAVATSPTSQRHLSSSSPTENSLIDSAKAVDGFSDVGDVAGGQPRDPEEHHPETSLLDEPEATEREVFEV